MKLTRLSVFLFTVILFSFCLTSLTACKTMRTSEKAVSKSETASVTASRLTFYRTIDSLSRQLNLSIDSISIIFQDPERPEFLSAVPSEIEGHLETPSDSAKFGSPSSSALQSHKWPRNAKARQESKPPDNASRSKTSVPHRITVYGLHLNDNIEEKSIEQADLKDSVASVTQSKESKSASKQSSSPNYVLKDIFFIIILVCILYVIYRCRRFLKSLL